MVIEKNSRQMPSNSMIKEKNYCDLLYAWLQCKSERVNMNDKIRRVPKEKIKWVKIEQDFIRPDKEGKMCKIMERRTIAKYFNFLLEKGYITEEDDGYYYLETLPSNEATLIEYETLSKMVNTVKQNVINIYIYLFNRYYANGCQPFIATMKQIKSYLGIATTTTSNNLIVSDSIDILERLGLLRMEMITKDGKSNMQFITVRNRLPDK